MSNLFERFMDKVERGAPNECWTWRGTTLPQGYGQIRIATKMKRAHRISYAMFVGHIPTGMLVLHRCDNPSCVNPEHLFVGSYRDNAVDAVNKGRNGNQNIGKMLCKRGHALVGANVYTDKRGYRTCTVCSRARAKEAKYNVA